MGVSEAKELLGISEENFIKKLNRVLIEENSENQLVNSIIDKFELINNSLFPSSHQTVHWEPPVVKGKIRLI